MRGTKNTYESKPIEQNKCIQIHGSKCMVCGLGLGRFYGTDFKVKINVHHIRPLHLIDENYKVNSERDLVPVCPNCHIILHSKEDGTFSIKEVQEMIEGSN